MSASATTLGVAVIGAGTIGTLRARLCRADPRVGYLAVCDLDAGRREAAAAACGADAQFAEARAAIERPEVDAVIVATSEERHFEPAMAAIEAGRPVLVEKPFTIDPAEGEALVRAAAEHGVALCVGFTQRFRRRFQSAKQQLLDGYLGELTSAAARISITRAVAETVITRAPSTTPAINTLNYCADLVLWYAQSRPVAVYAAHSRGEIHERFGAPDATSAVVTFDDGLVATLGVSWEPPSRHPANVASMQLDLFGRDGTLEIRDDHRDFLLVSNAPIPSPYPPHAEMHAALPGSAMPGEWALGRFYGPMGDETRAFLEGVACGAMPAALPDGEHGLAVLQLTRAIDASATSGQVVSIVPALARRA